jgi:uncharacterized membrane protein
MESSARIAGHAIHPMLIVLPLGLLSTAVFFDVCYFVLDNYEFAVASGYAMGAGIVGGLAAALFGWIDWFDIPARTRAKRIGLLHGVSNGVVLALFTVAWLVRFDAGTWDAGPLPFTLEVLGLALVGVAGWLGGELVERLGVGVDDGAELDAPSSLSHDDAAWRVGRAA